MEFVTIPRTLHRCPLCTCFDTRLIPAYIDGCGVNDIRNSRKARDFRYQPRFRETLKRGAASVRADILRLYRASLRR